MVGAVRFVGNWCPTFARRWFDVGGGTAMMVSGWNERNLEETALSTSLVAELVVEI